MKKFFSGLLVTILIIIILGGLGYIGYSLFFMGNHSSMNMQTNTAQNNATQNQANTQGSNNPQSSMNMQGDSMNMQGGSMNMQGDSMNMQGGSMNMQGQSSGSQSTLLQVNYALQNKESIDRIISMLNDVIKSATMESYSSNNTVTNPGQSSGMGISYDTARMEQFHTGLYKLTTGIESLKQIEEELMKQAEQAAIDVKDKTAYYTNQYNMTLQSKSKLNQALYDINEASNLLNVNPYISSNGIVYDKDRMQQVHGNILKLAQSVTVLNKLSSDMTKQAVTLIGTAQSYASSMDMSSMDMSIPGIFGGFNMSGMVNILLIVFAGAFVIGLFGFISSMFKPSSLQVNKN